MQFYENFVRLSAQSGKSLAQVARDIGVQKSTVSRWANGSAPRDTTLVRIADYFGITTKELLGADPMPEAKAEEPVKQKESGLAAAMWTPGSRMRYALSAFCTTKSLRQKVCQKSAIIMPNERIRWAF